MFYQADLFEQVQRLPAAVELPALVKRVSLVSKRPRYVLLVLNMVAKAAKKNGNLGPYVQSGGGQIPVRDWLCQALAPLANRDCRRMAMVEAVRSELTAKTSGSHDVVDLDKQLDDEVQSRILRSRRTNVSRAVSDLVRAGLLLRHYQGYRVDHLNRGAQREVVYTVSQEVRLALGGNR